MNILKIGMEPISSLAWADLTHADFQKVKFRYIDDVRQKGCGDQNWQKANIWYEKQHVMVHMLVYTICL